MLVRALLCSSVGATVSVNELPLAQAWCQTTPCVDHPLIAAVHERVINVTLKANGEAWAPTLLALPGLRAAKQHDRPDLVQRR